MSGYTRIFQHKNGTYDFSCSAMTPNYEADGEPCLPLRYPRNYKLVREFDHTTEGIKRLNCALQLRKLGMQYLKWLEYHHSVNVKRLK